MRSSLRCVRSTGLAAGIAVWLAMVSGCAEYRLGTTLPSGLRSVYVPTFLNQCGEPQVETETTRAAVQELQKDGTLRVAPTLELADAVLTVTLTGYELEPLRFEKNSPKTTKEYRMKIKAKVVLKWARTHQVLVERDVEGSSTFLPTGDISASKSQALPATATDLAHHIVVSVVEYW